jgi:outer membrane scaffolding protein for murein synthesis (MipA/OmpV family)
LATARGDEPFAFEAADESFGFSVFNKDGLGIGVAANLEGKRSAKDVGAPLDTVKTTFEAGAFLQYQFSRASARAPKCAGASAGMTDSSASSAPITSSATATRICSRSDPRVSLSDSKYHRAYFGVTPGESVRTGLAAYRPDGGVHAVGATAGFLTQLTNRWGLYSYAKYDRLVGDAASSPIVRTLGSRNQLSGGLALTYTFGG